MFETLYRIGFSLAQWRAKKPEAYRAPFPVISVGNLSVGGTGKSVVVSYLAKLFKKPAILLRGYRGSNSRYRASKLVSDGRQQYCDVSTAGDEAIMLSKQTGAIVVVGKNRAASAKLLQAKKLNPSAVILDDAYQHHSLHKNLEILLLDARWPLENGHCIPAGRLREKDCSRADVVLLTHCELVPDGELKKAHALVEEQLREQGSRVPVLHAQHRVSGIKGIDGPVVVLAGIGSFAQFVSSVERQGVQVARSYDMGDHARYTSASIKALSFDGAVALVTTAKDAVTLAPLADLLPVPLHVVSVSLGFKYPEEEKLFAGLVESCISNA